MAALAKSTPQALQLHSLVRPRALSIAGRAMLCSSKRWSGAARSSAWRPSVGHCRRAAKSRMTMIEAAGASGKPKRVRLSELFAPGKDTLAIYSFMFGPERGAAVSGLHAFPRWSRRCLAAHRPAHQPRRRRQVAAVAHPFLRQGARLAMAATLSTAGNAYDRDYFGDHTEATRLQGRRGMGHADPECVPPWP